MYKKATTLQEQTRFMQIWADFCEESQLPFLDLCEQSYKYVIKGEKGEDIGTLEVGKYDANHSNIENWFPFSRSSEVLKAANIHEVSKFTIDRRYRGTGLFKQVIVLLAQYGKEENVDVYIGIINPRIYKYVRTMGFRIFPIGEQIQLGDDVVGIPFILDAKHGLKHLMQFNDLRHLFQKTLAK